jgi:hypothetical protein
VPAPSSFDYAIIRVVPRVEREEFINAGVVLFCTTQRYLGARIELDEARLKALSPDVDLDLVRGHLESFRRVCEGRCTRACARARAPSPGSRWSTWWTRWSA